jgi:hypothetical protein
MVLGGLFVAVAAVQIATTHHAAAATSSGDDVCNDAGDNGVSIAGVDVNGQSGYYVLNQYGQVCNYGSAPYYGVDLGNVAGSPVAISSYSDGGSAAGYVEVTSSGYVDGFGHVPTCTTAIGGLGSGEHIVGITVDEQLNGCFEVSNFGTVWYNGSEASGGNECGSDAGLNAVGPCSSPSQFAGIAANPDGGYTLVNQGGQLYTFGFGYSPGPNFSLPSGQSVISVGGISNIWGFAVTTTNNGVGWSYPGNSNTGGIIQPDNDNQSLTQVSATGANFPGCGVGIWLLANFGGVYAEAGCASYEGGINNSDGGAPQNGQSGYGFSQTTSSPSQWNCNAELVDSSRADINGNANGGAETWFPFVPFAGTGPEPETGQPGGSQSALTVQESQDGGYFDTVDQYFAGSISSNSATVSAPYINGTAPVAGYGSAGPSSATADETNAWSLSGSGPYPSGYYLTMTPQAFSTALVPGMYQGENVVGSGNTYVSAVTGYTEPIYFCVSNWVGAGSATQGFSQSQPSVPSNDPTSILLPYNESANINVGVENSVPNLSYDNPISLNGGNCYLNGGTDIGTGFSGVGANSTSELNQGICTYNINPVAGTVQTYTSQFQTNPSTAGAGGEQPPNQGIGDTAGGSTYTPTNAPHNISVDWLPQITVTGAPNPALSTEPVSLTASVPSCSSVPAGFTEEVWQLSSSNGMTQGGTPSGTELWSGACSTSQTVNLTNGSGNQYYEAVFVQGSSYGANSACTANTVCEGSNVLDETYGLPGFTAAPTMCQASGYNNYPTLPHTFGSYQVTYPSAASGSTVTITNTTNSTVLFSSSPSWGGAGSNSTSTSGSTTTMTITGAYEQAIQNNAYTDTYTVTVAGTGWSSTSASLSINWTYCQSPGTSFGGGAPTGLPT